MKILIALLSAGCLESALSIAAEPASAGAQLSGREQAAGIFHQPPMGKPGRTGRYRNELDGGLRASVVEQYTLALGPIEQRMGEAYQWMLLDATKANGGRFKVWFLSAGYPPDSLADARRTIVRYILEENGSEPLEFRHRFTGEAVLPALGGWPHLLPRSADDAAASPEEIFPRKTRYLGHRYQLEEVRDSAGAPPPQTAKMVALLPDVLIGVPSNTRQKDDTRRYDNSDYELVRLTRENYREMAEAGINCVRVDAEQVHGLDGLNVFYWGVGGNDVPYPEGLYHSQYLGPALFLDEPAVVTRDTMIRPRLEKDQAFRKALTPQVALEALQEHFRHILHEGAPTSLLKGLKARADVDLGDMNFTQENLYSWETIVSSAAYQLSQDPRVPAAMVFEPPGRVGTLRTVPELNMTYGCQLAADDPKNLTDIIYGFLRGAARLTGKSWGMSIYGAVDRADAFWYLTHAYDLGATHFFFWDNARLACVPYRECLVLARNLRAHAENFPHRDLNRLRRAAEVGILLPAGYNLGHVHLGKGSLWGVGELNLERVNRHGVKYRTVMSNFFTEIERCLRLGVAFDLFWDLPAIRPAGYRELVRILEEGKVEIEQDGKRVVLDQARTPMRPPGIPPGIEVDLSAQEGTAPLAITARARVTENSAPVYYTLGTDTEGVYHNAVVAWEIYGPGEEDYRILQPPGMRPHVARNGNLFEVTVNFTLHRSGQYRLRAATVDLAGRTTVNWVPVAVTD
ncbi:MAG: hypothetical protein HY735_30145 [Verrucomicrobia bacterium]|nr:hypothetical protein [Verrucomicrobiota bacterium]